MFTSSNNNINNGVDPVFYNDQQRPFFTDIITSTNPKPDDLPFPFFYLPSPLLPPYELELEEHGVLLQQEHDLFLHHQPLSATTNTCVSETILNMVDSGGKETTKELPKVSNKRLQGASEQIPIRRRSSKRDRHSKINTAQGPRDRRMRLSLKVAREFFDVQDKLGFDKASKTVEWLLIQSKPAIEKLFSGLPQIMNSSCKSVSSTSECEVVSGIDEAALKVSNVPKGKPSPRGKKERKTRSSSRKTTSQVLGRESRDMRRARARVRTLEKKWSQKLDESKPCEEATNYDMFQLGSWSAFETGEESGTQSYNVNPPSSLDAISHKQDRSLTTEGLIDDSFVVMSKWSPSSIFNHLQNTSVPQELHFAEFQPFCKPW